MALLENQLNADPLQQFSVWLREAVERLGAEQATAMCLSTLDGGGFPDARMVLLKEVDDRGFVFYTNLESPKGRALAAHPKAALTFHWPAFERQVRVQGTVELVSTREADAYFHSRPRLSQLGAWASKQSAPLKSRFTLMREVARLALKYPLGEIPRPPHWSGYRVHPVKIEFWQAGKNRLHDRFVYRHLDSGAWAVERLYP